MEKKVLKIRGLSLENLLLWSGRNALSSSCWFHGLVQQVGDP